MAILHLLAIRAFAQNWEAAGFGAGGFFPQIAVDPINAKTVYLTSDVSGLYKSTNYGDAWFPINSGLTSREVGAFAIDPVHPEHLWAGTPLGLYSSTNGGSIWSLATAKLVCYINVNYRGISINRNGVILVAAHHQVDDAEPPVYGILDGQLYRSIDGGANWTLNAQLQTQFAGTHTRFPAVVFDPHNDDQAYLLADGVGILKSTDSGVTWTYFTNGLPPGPATWKNMDVGSNVVYATAIPSQPYKSPKDHASWQLIANGVSGVESVDYAPADTIRVSPSNDDMVYLGQAGWPSVLYRSTDGGNHWSGRDVLNDYTFDTRNAPFQSWNDQFQAPICLAIDPSNPNRVYYTTWWGAWRSDDGGATWAEKIIGAPNTVCTDIASQGDTLFSTHMDVGLYRSQDQGWTWLNCLPKPGQRTAELHAWSVKAGPGGMLYAGITLPTAPAVGCSSDQGITWQIKTNGLYQPPDFDMGSTVALAVDPTRLGTVYLSVESFLDNRAIHRSTDFGETWSPLPQAPGSAGNSNSRKVKCIEVDPTNPERLLAGLFWDGLWFSENGGATWARAQGRGTDIDYASVQRIVALTNGAVYAAFDNGFYRSLDHGRTFTALLTNANWGEQPAFEYVYGVAFKPNNLDEIFISTAKNYPIWHNRGSVWRSRDGGSTWLDITANLPVKNVVALNYHAGYLYAATAGANVYRYRVDESAPAFRIEGISLNPNDQVVLRWPSSTNQQFTLLVATNLIEGFTIMSEGLPAQPPMNVYTDSVMGVEQKYYRIMIAP